MKKRLVAIVAPLLGALIANPLWAASFNITNNQTVAQTLAAGNTGTVSSSGNLSVSGKNNAISVQGSSTISNSGIIAQTGSARAIRDTVDAALTLTVTNNPGASMSAAANDVIEIQYGDNNVQFNNLGNVTASGTSDQALNFNHITTGSNVLNNYSTGVIQSTAADAVRLGINGVVNNDGSIKVVTPSGDTSSSDGIDAQTNSGITINNTVLANDPANSAGGIEGERHGITGGNTSNTGSPIGAYVMHVSNAANFTIQGDNGSGMNIDGVGVSANTGAYDISGSDPAVTSNEMVIVNNAGTIIGNGVTRDGDGVDVDGLVQVTNSGTIRSQCAAGDTSEGITVGGGIITNQAGGLIEGDNTAGKFGCNPVLNSITGTGRGITLSGVDHDVNNNDAPIVPNQAIYGYSTIDNFGKVYGDSDSAIAVTSGSSQYLVTIINEAGGTLEGAGQTQAAISTGANQAAIFNAGTISADNSGLAIDLGSGDGTHTDSVLIVGGSAQVNGNIAGSTSSPSTLTVIPNARYSYVANASYSYDASTGTGTTSIIGSGNSFSYAGVISNITSAEFGNGKTILTGTSVNTYTGNTTVDQAGILQVDGSIASAQTQVAGTLQGTGSLSGTVEIQNGGALHPGDIAGDTETMSVVALTLDPGSTATFDLGAAAASNDAINASATVTIDSAAMLAIHLPATPLPGEYTLINAGNVNGTFAAPSFSPALPGSLVATVAYAANSVTLQLQTASSVALQSSLNPSQFGQSITFTATVTGSSPSGSVTFLDGTTPLASIALNGVVATLTTTSLSVASHTITARYDGDANNTSSSSSAVQQQVNAAISGIGLSTSITPSSFGQSVTFTATVTGNSPSGSVSFLDGTMPLATTALSGGVASFTTTSLGVGAHTITADYPGDGDNAASNSRGLAQQVNTAATTTTVSAAEAITLGQSATISASVNVTTPGAGTPSGTISISDGGNAAGDVCTITLPSTSCTLTPGSAGNKTLTATYAGDGNFAGSSGSGTLGVGTIASTLRVSSSQNPSTAGQAVTFTAVVSSASLQPTHAPRVSSMHVAGAIGANAVPGGTVSFSSDRATPVVIALSDGTASYTTSALSAGSHAISVSYSGDANTAASTTTYTQTVAAAATTPGAAAIPAPALTISLLWLLGLLFAATSLVRIGRTLRDQAS